MLLEIPSNLIASYPSDVNHFLCKPFHTSALKGILLSVIVVILLHFHFEGKLLFFFQPLKVGYDDDAY